MKFLVDSGATYTLLPEKIWKSLGLKPIEEMEFVLADGSLIKRHLSEAWIEFQGRGRTVQVILGEEQDEALLGVLTLEAFGLKLNPFTRQIEPMRLLLTSFYF